MKYLRHALVPVVAILLLSGCVHDKAVIAKADQTNAQLAPAIISDPELASYLQQVGDRIISAAKQLDAEGYGPKSHKSQDNAWMFSNAMEFHFVNSKTVNAFTTGGKHMYVYNALFQMCRDEDELAAVMSHEYGHVYCRHVAKGMDRAELAGYGVTGVSELASLYGGDENGSSYASTGKNAASLLATYLNNGFTRKDESQADEMGFNFYCHAGWEPSKFAEFFQQMIDAGYDKTPAIASDHPTLASRVKAVDEWVKKLPPDASSWRRPPVADAAKFKELQARANQIAKTTPDDTQIADAKQLLEALPRSCVMPYTPPDEQSARKAVLEKQTHHKKKPATRQAQ